ncbi:hypothetical protein AB836_02005 [Rickettsiales bacterium (ex Bugula neritina AB1)]|nr:hypothetical protein AB836_02005 [Rickettsiales bacterium (ex Bugula neritina AB1)]
MNKNYTVYSANRKESLNKYLMEVFLNMGLSLLLTFIVSFVIGYFFRNFAVFVLSSFVCQIVLLLANIVVISILRTQVASSNTTLATTLLYLFAFLIGVNTSYIYFIFTINEIFFALLASSIFFLSMFFFGLFTKKNLSKWSSILSVMLFSLLIMNSINLILFFIGYNISFINILLSSFSIILFSLYTAYDIQNIKNLYFAYDGDRLKSIGVYGALHLYLNFINIFQSILRIMYYTRKKDE